MPESFFRATRLPVLRQSVRVAMMNVGKVRMLVGYFCMVMRVSMRLLSVPAGVMSVLMVIIVPMRMSVCERFMRVEVVVPFGQVQPYA